MAVTKEWPAAKFYFDVNFGAGSIGFQTCDGLSGGISVMEFRDGNSTNFYKEKRPAMLSFEAVTLKKGVFAGEGSLYSWYKNVALNNLFGDMRTVTITLKDTSPGGAPLLTWTLHDAFITKFTPPSLDAESDEIACEEMEVVYQYFTVTQGVSLPAPAIPKKTGPNPSARNAGKIQGNAAGVQTRGKIGPSARNAGFGSVSQGTVQTKGKIGPSSNNAGFGAGSLNTINSKGKTGPSANNAGAGNPPMSMPSTKGTNNPSGNNAGFATVNTQPVESDGISEPSGKNAGIV